MDISKTPSNSNILQDLDFNLGQFLTSMEE